jgi:flavodoxin
VKTLVIYDSQYGNTEKVAQAIAESLNCEARLFKNVSPTQIANLDLLVVGSPTHGGRATPELTGWLSQIPRLGHTKVAAFDTRIVASEQPEKGWYRLLLTVVTGVLGYAAPRIARSLVKKGRTLVSTEGFIVKGKEGPLKEGEIERAKIWAQGLLSL